MRPISMPEIPFDAHGFVFRSAALAYGLTDAQLKRAASKTRHLSKLAPGIYLRRPEQRCFRRNGTG
ncbi:hypothetical protein [Gordonia effusa]|uniref:hypothetical protein n=1 Tax=Gordonia effusa TaxID=263908 RepID=UPI001FE1D4FF|nr:hypothetical protein [Gordonia effusa]